MSTHPRQLPQASQHRGVGFITPSHPNPSGAGVDTASHILPSFGARASSRAAGGNIISPACPRDPREAAFGHQPPHVPPSMSALYHPEPKLRPGYFQSSPLGISSPCTCPADTSICRKGMGWARVLWGEDEQGVQIRFSPQLIPKYGASCVENGKKFVLERSSECCIFFH